MVQKKLKACNIDLTHISFANITTSPYNVRDAALHEQVVHDLIQDGYRYIYVDSAEDFGMDWVNKLLAKTLLDRSWSAIVDRGDFWITVDPYQGLGDNHTLVKGKGNQIRWVGNLADDKLLEEGIKMNRILKLEECFRMPLAMIKHIESEKVLPTSELPKAKHVKSLGVVEKNINFHNGYSIRSLADNLARHLNEELMQRGIHPGQCAVLFDGDAVVELFPPQEGGLPAFLQVVNETLRAIPVKSQAGHMMQMSSNIEETLLYSTNRRSSASNSASNPLLAEIFARATDTTEYQTEKHAEVIPIILTNKI